MQVPKLDKRGAVSRYYTGRDTSIKFQKDFNRAVNLLYFIHLHGYANSKYLYEWDGGGNRNCRGLLYKLRKAGYVYLPKFQEETVGYQGHNYIYALTDLGHDMLINARKHEEVISVARDGKHDYGVACITGSIHLACKKAGIEYVPGHVLLERADTPLSYDLGKKTLRADQLFAIDYGDKRTIFSVEFDRGTEPGTTKKNRKAYTSTIEDYDRYIRGGLFKDHLKVKNTGMMCLYVFSNYASELKFHRVLAKKYDKCGWIATQSIEGYVPIFKPYPPAHHLFDESWNRHGYSDTFTIHTP